MYYVKLELYLVQEAMKPWVGLRIGSFTPQIFVRYLPRHRYSSSIGNAAVNKTGKNHCFEESGFWCGGQKINKIIIFSLIWYMLYNNKR